MRNLWHGQPPKYLSATKATENAATAYALLARALILRNNLAAAQETADRALSLSRESGSRPPRFEAVLASAR